MVDKHGYMEEEAPGTSYDTAMLKRLLPFARPYRLPILISILIVVLITIMDVALPYVTKIAIDRYIVPVTKADSAENSSAPDQNHPAQRKKEQPRYYTIDATLPENAAIIRKYPALFIIQDTRALITFESLAKLPAEELKVLRKRDLSGVGLVALAFLVLIILDFGFNFIQKYIMEYTGHMLMHDLRISLFRHIQGLSISFFSKNPVGRLVTRVTNDIQNMHELFTTVIAFIFNDVCLLVGITAVLISINLHLTLVAFLVLPFVWMAAMRFAKKARGIFRTLRIKIAEINTRFSETIGGMKVIQLFRHENENYRSFEALNHDNYLAGMDQIRLMAVFMPLIEILGMTSVAFVVFYGGNRVLSRAISLGDLVAFISYIRMFFRPIRDVAEKYNVVQNALASAERIFLILDSKDSLPTPPSIRTVSETVGKVRTEPFSRLSFENVSFSYLPNEPVLKEISFDLKAGETLGIVGPTGSGKTTMINLITRFYDPTAGKVSFNGKDMRSLPREAYLSGMALVMQDPFLFSGTIRENIMSGNGNYTDEALETILTVSNCKDMVDRAHKGLDTQLSEAGGSISSGERQLISIARAFARNPELIVMDEATSYIDSQTEQKIQTALFNLMENRTAIVVAHRLATVRKLDRILVVRKGRIIEAGSHESLMVRKGFYYSLHQTRSKMLAY